MTESRWIRGFRTSLWPVSAFLCAGAILVLQSIGLAIGATGGYHDHWDSTCYLPLDIAGQWFPFAVGLGAASLVVMLERRWSFHSRGASRCRRPPWRRGVAVGLAVLVLGIWVVNRTTAVVPDECRYLAGYVGGPEVPPPAGEAVQAQAAQIHSRNRLAGGAVGAIWLVVCLAPTRRGRVYRLHGEDLGLSVNGRRYAWVDLGPIETRPSSLEIAATGSPPVSVDFPSAQRAPFHTLATTWNNLRRPGTLDPVAQANLGRLSVAARTETQEPNPR